MEQRPENKYSPAEVAFARQLAIMRITLDISPKATWDNGSEKTIHEPLDLPIHKIDGIEVDVKVVMNSKDVGRMNLIVRHEYFYTKHLLFDKWFNFTKETAQEDTMKLLEVIKSLKFNKKTTLLESSCDCEKEEEMNPELWCGLFEDCEKIKLNWDMCCVCHEIANSKFKECRHTICLECCDKLKEIDDGEVSIRCPICREDYNGDRERYIMCELLETF